MTWTEYLEGKDKGGVEGWIHLLKCMFDKTPKSVNFLNTIKPEKIQYKKQLLFKALDLLRILQNAIPHEFIGGLIVQGAELDLTDPKVHDVFISFLDHLLTQKSLDGQQIEVLEAIFDRDLIPWKFLSDNQSFFKLLDSREDLPNSIRVRRKKIDPKAIENYEQLMQLKHELDVSDRLKDKYPILCQMIEKAELLKKENFPSMSLCFRFLNAYMNKKFGKLNQLLDDVQSDEKSWSNKYNRLNHREQRFILNRLYCLKRYQKLMLVLSAQENDSVSHSYVHFLLDKVIFPNKQKFHGECPYWTSIMLANAIKKITDSTESPVSKMDRATWDTMKRFLTDHFLPMLHQCSLWNYSIIESIRNKTDIPSSLFNQVASRIEKMKIGTKILIPTGSIGHTTGIVVEKTASNRLRLSFYNTGKGLRKHHPRWKKNTSFTNLPHLYKRSN